MSPPGPRRWTRSRAEPWPPPPIRNAQAEGTYPVIPLLQVGAMAHSKPYVAAAPIQKALGFPGELVEDWHDKAIAKMGELLGKYRSLKVYMDACVHCGACTDKCHYFLGTGDPKNMPVARQDLMRKVYRRHFTFAGKFSQAGRRRGPDERSARRLVHLFQPVLGMPPLLGVLPLRHRHRRDHHGRARRSWTPSAWARSTPTRSSARCTRSATTWAPRAGAGRHLAGPGGRHQGRNRRRRALPARREGRRSAAGHALGRLLLRAARRKPDRLCQGVPRRRHQLDAELPRLGGRQLRPVHRQLRADAQHLAARARGRAGAGRQAHHRRRMRPCLARGLQLLEHADRPVRLSRPALSRCRSTSANSPTT